MSHNVSMYQRFGPWYRVRLHLNMMTAEVPVNHAVIHLPVFEAQVNVFALQGFSQATERAEAMLRSYLPDGCWCVVRKSIVICSQVSLCVLPPQLKDFGMPSPEVWGECLVPGFLSMEHLQEMTNSWNNRNQTAKEES